MKINSICVLKIDRLLFNNHLCSVYYYYVQCSVLLTSAAFYLQSYTYGTYNNVPFESNAHPREVIIIYY